VRDLWLPLTLAAFIVAIVVLLIWPGWAYQWRWTGFGASKSRSSKTLWDWMQLFLIPLMLAIAGFLLNRAQQRREQHMAKANRAQDQKIADDRQQEAVLEAYLRQMASLLLDKKLREPEQEGARQVARAQTLTALRRLDGTRRRALVEFLYEAQLIGYPAPDEHGSIATHPPMIALEKADLHEANLVEAFLLGANLGGADLRGADLRGAYLALVKLGWANLTRADLTGADLRGADLHEALLALADLRGADLTGANLVKAYLVEAKLGWADLRGADLHEALLALADLRGADLTGADLRAAFLVGADLGEATVTNEQLNDARSLAGATLPDGTRLPDDFKGPLPPRKTSAPSGTTPAPSPSALSSPPTSPDASQVP
jgi:uncharacterized protein YjbI with pentapeptide repeats